MSEQEVSDNFEFGPGALLKQAREQQDISIKEVADRLKLMEKSVKDIESDDYKDIPITFIKGYVKNYAQMLGLDVQETTENFNRYVAKNGLDNSSTTSSFRPPRANNNSNVKYVRIFIRLISTLLVIALLYSIYYLLAEKGYWNKFIDSFDKKETIEGQPLETEDTDNEGELIPDDLQMQLSSNVQATNVQINASQKVNQQPETTQAPLEDLAPTDLTIAAKGEGGKFETNNNQVDFDFSGDCWLQLVDSRGQILVTGTKRSGHVSSVSGIPPYQLTIGKVSTVSIHYQGKEIDLSSYTDARIARLTIGS